MFNKTTFQIEGTSKAVPEYYSFEEKTGFMLHDNKGADTPVRSTLLTKLIAESNYIFWKLQLDEYSETHSESVNVINTFADVSHIQTMGALPIQVNASGFLYTAKCEDHRIDFLDIYHQIFRGTINWEQDVLIKLYVKDTAMFFFFTGMSVSNRSDAEDMTFINFSGIGYKYINVYR